MSARGATVRFDAIAKRYADVIALDRFDLQVEAGELVTLLGPSGSGKTTALNLLAGFAEPSAGRVSIGDADVTGLASEARGLGMVFQSFALFPHLSVVDNVAFPLRMRGMARTERRRRAEAMLERVHLPGLGARRPAELSGGQRQRVALARALVFEPAVLLMDECLSALDLKLRETLQGEIRALHTELGTTILFVTHDQGEALTLSDRIVVMSEGRIRQVGTPAEVYDRPADRFVAGFIGTTNVLEVRSEGTNVHIPSLELSLVRPAHWPTHTVSVGVRPEALRRAPGDAGTVMHVVDAVFLGDSVQYSLTANDGTPLLLREPRPGGTIPVEPGSPLQLSVDLESLVPLTDGEEPGSP